MVDQQSSGQPLSQPGSAGAFPDLGALFGGSPGAANPLAALTDMLATAQRNLAAAAAEGAAGGGAVRVSLDGARRVTAVAISPDVFESGDAEMLQDLIVAAANDAFEQIDAQKAEALGGMAGLFGGLDQEES